MAIVPLGPGQWDIRNARAGDKITIGEDGNITSVVSQGQTIYNGTREIKDENGNVIFRQYSAVSNAVPKAPLSTGAPMPQQLTFPILGDYRISSPFGSRSSPGGIGSTNHKGIDIAVPTGTPVVAPTDIKITQAGWSGGYGNLIRGMDDAGNTYEFGHLSQIGVKPGDVVQQGTQIGKVGSTGNSTGPHLHFGIKDATGKFINPSDLLSKAKQAGQDALKKGADALKKAAVIAAANTIGGPVAGAIVAADVLGGGEECGSLDFICKLKKWLKEGDFFTRLALVIMAIILLVAGFAILARSQLGRVISTVKKG